MITIKAQSSLARKQKKLKVRFWNLLNIKPTEVRVSSSKQEQLVKLNKRTK
jgi:hypothetical protein